MRLPSGTWLMPIFTIFSAGTVVISWPLKVIEPSRGRRMPERVRRIVDLPAAVGADEGDYLALLHVERNALEGVDRAVVYVEVLNSQHFCRLLFRGRPR